VKTTTHEILSDLVTQMERRIDVLHALDDTGSVLMWGHGLCVGYLQGNRVAAVSVERAEVITNDQVGAMLEQGVGLPLIKNGAGEVPRLTPRRVAIDCAIESAEATLVLARRGLADLNRAVA
jgi:hypothetical protein